MGFCKTALLWLRSYVTGRELELAVVSKFDGASPRLSTNLGVSQGRVLGPMLFYLYINDIFKHISYADGLQIYVQVSYDDLSSGIEMLEQTTRSSC